MGVPVPRYELLDHTADLGIEVSAATVEGLFEEAALAMFDLLTDLSRVDPKVARRIDVAGVDREDLLVGWLGELLSICGAENLLFGRFRVEALGDRRLSATAEGEPFDASRHVIKRELKAVTHHAARVREDQRGVRGQVIFDV